MFNKVKRNDYGVGSDNIHKKLIRYFGRKCYIPSEGVNCFFSRIL